MSHTLRGQQCQNEKLLSSPKTSLYLLLQERKDAQHAAQLTVQTWIHCAAILLHVRTTAESSDRVPQLIDVLQSVCLSCWITPCIYDCNGIMDTKMHFASASDVLCGSE